MSNSSVASQIINAPNPSDTHLTEANIGHIRNKLLDPELTVQQHIELVNKHSVELYITAIKSLAHHSIPLSVASKARNIVALWATKNFAAVDEIIPKLLPAEV